MKEGFTEEVMLELIPNVDVPYVGKGGRQMAGCATVGKGWLCLWKRLRGEVGGEDPGRREAGVRLRSSRGVRIFYYRAFP